MKRLIAIALILCATQSFASIEDTVAKKDTVPTWSLGGDFNLQFSQSSFQHWAAGGVNSITMIGLVNYKADLTSEKMFWKNSISLNYGLSKLEGQDVRKSDDRIEITTSWGTKAKDKWYYSALGNFRTQFAQGFDFTTPSPTLISNLMAPGYLTIALGMDYKPNKDFSVMISPASGKSTFVMDEELSNQGAFGVDSGATVRHEFGGTINMQWNKELMKNVNYKTKLTLFSNYFNNPQNIDINWENLVFLKINKFLTSSVIFHLIYDDDIDIPLDRDGDGITESTGKRAQLKQVLGLGFSYKF